MNPNNYDDGRGRDYKIPPSLIQEEGLEEKIDKYFIKIRREGEADKTKLSN